MSWNAEQLAILRELGHEPMLLAASFGAGAPVGAAFSRDSDVSGSMGQSRQNAAPTASPERLLAALVRAAGGRDVAGLVPDLEQLRREPALKRALWPRLRALRRGH